MVISMMSSKESRGCYLGMTWVVDTWFMGFRATESEFQCSGMSCMVVYQTLPDDCSKD